MIGKFRGRVVVVALAVIAAGCGSADPEPLPPAPTMIPFSGDPFIETGIRPDPEAASEAGGILLQWREPGAAELDGASIGAYIVYRSDSTRPDGSPAGFHPIASITVIPVGNDTTFSDTTAAPYVRYWYAVGAESRSGGGVGPMSDAVAYTLSVRPIPVAPIGQLDSIDVSPLRFRYGPPILGGEVAIHLYRVHPDNERVVLDTIWRSLGRGTFDDPTVAYDGPALTPGAHYRWRIDKITSRQPIGNASSWVTFVAP